MRLENAVALFAGVILLAGTGLVARASARRGDGMVTALSVFLAIWGLVLVLSSLRWVRYTATSLEAWIAVYGSICAFVIGCGLAMRTASPTHSDTPEAVNPRRLRVLWLACALIGLIGFADFVHAIDVTIGWRALIDHPDLVRITESTSQKFKSTYGGLKLLTYFEIPAFLLWTVGLRVKSFHGRWRVAGALGWLCLTPFMFTADRTLILTALVWTGCFHLIWRPVRRAARLLPAVAAVLVGFVIVFTLLGNRITKTINAHPEIKAQLTTQTLSSLALPYVYLTSEAPLMSKLMADPVRPRTYGRMTTLPAVKLLHAAGIGGTPPEEVGAFYPIPFESVNTYSWLGTFFLDFGLAGCLVLPALLGAGFTVVVLDALRRRRLVSIWFASLALYVVVFSPIVNKLSTTFTWEYGILGPIVFASLRPDRPEQRGFAGFLSRIERASRIAIGVSVAVAALAVFVLVHHSSARTSTRTDAKTLSRELASAMQRALLMRQAGLFPSSEALSSRLHVSDPAVDYIPVAPPTVAPVDKGVIGVDSTGSALTLGIRADSGVTQISSPAPALALRRLGPGGNLVASPYFDGGLRGPWSATTNGVARLSVVRTPSWRGHASLIVAGTGRAGTGSTVVFQLFGALPSARRGAIYDFGFVAQRRNLDRTVIAWIKLNYLDGTYLPVVARPLGGTARAAGIPPGTDTGWRAFGASLPAGKPLASIELFVCDTGAARLHGTVQISDVSLTLRRSGGRAFANVPALPPA